MFRSRSTHSTRTAQSSRAAHVRPLVTRYRRHAAGMLVASAAFVTIGAGTSAATDPSDLVELDPAPARGERHSELDAPPARGEVNSTPVAVDDEYSTPKDTTLEVTAPGVLENDHDPDGDKLSVRSYRRDLPSDATVTNTDSDGSFRYTPAPGFVGTDQLTYLVTDGKGAYDNGTVTITVTESVNRPPVAEDDEYTTEKDTALAVNIFDNDSDPDGDSFVATRPLDGPQHGEATLNRSNGELTYTPAPGFVGTDTFNYQISDDNGGFSRTATVTIEVTEAGSGPGDASDPDETPDPSDTRNPGETPDPAKVTTRAPARPATPDYTG